MKIKLLLVCVPVFVFASAGCMQSPEAKSAHYIAAGQKLLKKNDPARAILEFRNAVQAAPRNAEAYYQLGMAYLQVRDYRSALAGFHKAIELNPKHTEAKLRIAQMLSLTTNQALLKEAEGELELLVQSPDANAEVLDTLAMTELKLGETGSAVDVLQKALTQFSPEMATYAMLAQARLRQNDSKGAEDVLKKGTTDLPKSLDAHRLLAEFYISEHRFTEAEPELRKVVGLDPQNGAALLDIARVQAATGRKQDAEQTFKRLSRIAGYRPLYGVFLFQDGRPDEAAREMERAARENPDDRQVRGYLLALYQALKRPADIDRVLDTALRRNAKDYDALLKRAEIFSQRGQYDKAENDINAVIKGNPNVPEVHYLRAQLFRQRGMELVYRQELAEALRLRPGMLTVRIELAQDYVNQQDGQAALETLDAAPVSQRSDPRLLVARNWALWTKGDLASMRKGIDEELAKHRSSEFLIQDALWKFRTGNIPAAQAALREALNMDPGNLLALQALNSTYVSQKNMAMALTEVKQYAARTPKSAPVQNLLAEMLLARGEVAQARAVLNAAKAVAPNSPELDLSLTQADYMEHKYDQACARLEAVLAADPKQQFARLWLGYIELKRGNHQAAIGDFRKALDSNPDNAMAGNDLAYELAEHNGDLDEALKYAQKAVEVAPDKPAFADTLGWILYRKGLYPSALPYLEQANKDPNDAVAKYHLAMAYAKLGDRRHSVDTLDAALKLNPNLPEAKVARDLVGSPR